MKKLFVFLAVVLCFAFASAQSPCPPTATIDGVDYTVVQVGSQCWTASNMRNTHYSDGEEVMPVPLIFVSSMAPDFDVTRYGYLYTPAAATRAWTVVDNEIQGICPEGWRIPTQADMSALLAQVSVEQLMASEDWLPQGGSNTVGFNLLPAGICNGTYNSFENYRVTTMLLTAEPSGTMVYHPCKFGDLCGSWEFVPGRDSDGYSVRCVRDVMPIVTTDSVTTVTKNSARLYGNVSSMGSYTEVTAGFRYGQHPDYMTFKTESIVSDTGSYNAELTNISPNTTYYFQAYAATTTDTIWAADTLNFTTLTVPCLGTPKTNERGATDAIDSVLDNEGNAYIVVQIGNQCWMAQNLRVTSSPAGNSLTVGKDASTEVSYYDQNTDYGAEGYMYNWRAAMDLNVNAVSITSEQSNHRGLCPQGWHIPTRTEWETLNNVSDFHPIAAGYFSNGNINDGGVGANFTTATSGDEDKSFYIYVDIQNSPDNLSGAYASKSLGLSVRCLRDAETPATPMSVTTDSANTVTKDGATLYGNVTSLGDNAQVTAGFRYGQHPDYMAFKVENTASATGSYNAELTGISPNTTYYFQAYAATATDTAWAADTLTFTTLTVPCLGTVRANERATELGIDSVLDNEGNSYITVQIGNQCWMAENLRATKYQNSEVIDSDIPSTATSTTTPYMYYPKGQETLVGSLGYLYNYPAVADNRNICPEGWHVPTDGEWFALEKQVLDLTPADSTRENLGGTKVGKMTAGIDWTITTVETAPGNMLYTDRNNSGFSAYPSHFFGNGSFQSDVEGYFWCSTEKDNDNAWGKGITSTDQGIYRYPQYKKSFGFSVRCLRDADTPTAFTCGTDKVKDVDDNEYNTVAIGNQCWMKENMKTTRYADMQAISSNEMFNPGDSVDNVATYGKLYTWYAATRNSSTTYPAEGQVKVQGICPTGWHVPSNAEWDTLTTYVYNSTDPDYKCDSCESSGWEQSTNCIAKALASKTGWNSNETTCNVGNEREGNNSTGFSAVPAGSFFTGDYNGFNTDAFFWSATKYDGYAYRRYLLNTLSYVDASYTDLDRAYSVRCLRDAETLPVITDTIAFLPNGGQGTMDTMFVTRGDTALNANTYTHDGNWEFLGWNTEADGAGTHYDNQAALTTNGNLTLYAQWHTYCTGTPSDNEVGNARIDSLIDVDNNKYAVVQIGNQCWMKQNLRTITNTADTGNIYTPETDGYNVNTYGRLYDWAAVMQGESSTNYPDSGNVVQGICPTGWHVPSNAEWDTLTYYVYNSTDPDYKCSACPSSSWQQSTECIAKSLAATTGWKNATNTCTVGNNPENNNATGFSALPAGGIYFPSGQSKHNYFNQLATFSSATDVTADPVNIYIRTLQNTYSKVGFSSNTQKKLGFSVRCVRDYVQYN